MLSSREFLCVTKDAPAERKFERARAKSIAVCGSKIPVSLIQIANRTPNDVFSDFEPKTTP